MNIKKIKDAFHDMEGEHIYLFTVNAKEYLNTNIAILKEVVKRDDAAGIYVTLNRPYASLTKILQRNDVNTDRIFFIDGTTKIIGETKKAENVFYVESPQNLTALSVTITEAVEALPSKNKFLILDALTTLTIYNSTATVSRFLHFLTNRMRILKLDGILLSIEKELNPVIAEQLEQFIDKVIDLSE